MADLDRSYAGRVERGDNGAALRLAIVGGPQSTSPRTVISLFTGAGGLDLGLECAGFTITACVEMDGDARTTLQINRPHWRLATPGDIHEIEPVALLKLAGLKRRELAVLTGGPPCQPFSKSANWANGGTDGMLDPRSKTLTAYLEMVEAALPQVFVLENVRGLSENAKGLKRLRESIARINRKHHTNYGLSIVHLNAAEYGVPQVRERIFIVASREGHSFVPPTKTHGDAMGLQPYRTAWDAIGEYDVENWSPELRPTGKWAELLKSIPEGKNYLHHTPRGAGRSLFGWRTRYWSFLLKLSKRQPSWTIQAVPGPATGPFHWRNRLLTIEELARLQTFPLGYAFAGNRRSAHRQIGNAVPCAIGELLGREIRKQLLGDQLPENGLSLIPESKGVPPRKFPARPLHNNYRNLIANHDDHPGAGLGPGRVWAKAKAIKGPRGG